MRTAAKSAFAVGTVALLGLGSVGAYHVVHAFTGDDASSASRTFDPDAVSSTPPAPAKAVSFAQSFLGSWASGPAHYAGAASDTDAPDTTQAALRKYHDGLGLTSLSFSGVHAAGADPSVTGGAKVAFTVTARVTGGTWSYPGTLDVVSSGSGQDAVHWSPSVLYPGLHDDQTLVAGPVPPASSSVSVVASDGKTQLTAARYPSLGAIAATIAQNASGKSTGASGSGVSVADASGTPQSAVKVFTAPKAATVTTTIDPVLQAAAERAVLDPHVAGKPASVVALDRRTGHILAVAFHGPDGDTAINAELAPGSAMKIITSAALFDRMGMSPGSPAPCDATQLAAGQTFHNESDVPANPNATIEQAFAESCNTAFVYDGFHYLVHGDDASVLHDEAANVFGLGSWSIGGGVQTADPGIPADPQGSDKAAQFIGQAQVTMSPLVLASLAATVRDGAFHQPVILPGQAQTAAPQQMSARTAGYLRQMMRAVVTGGTATPRLGDLPDVGAKTGTAEVGDGTNGWLTAYDDDTAVASLVEGGSSGVDSAGYVVRTVLTAR
ncbi:penicillin-binding transpeptidase domain-containing protein [Streptantibioticus parmotrematis]|uniref:penicillin-binding transpeptidase domain-containing protein n=1 Tax=Streptantibioticus parmotrematis TaxID=2873249 RepID=UPI0033C6FDB5